MKLRRLHAAARLSGWGALVCLAACYTSEPLPADPDAEVATGAQALEANLDTVQAHVFEPACALSGCHDAATQAGMLDLSSADASYDSLLGTDGLGVPAANRVAAENRWLRIKPGDPDLSFVYRKLDLPGLGEGAPMPVGQQQVSEPYMALLQAWIEAGALR